jgi:hypothetical protein
MIKLLEDKKCIMFQIYFYKSLMIFLQFLIVLLCLTLVYMILTWFNVVPRLFWWL